MPSSKLVILIFLLVVRVGLGQSATVVLPAGTPLPVSIPKHLPMRAGEHIQAELLYDVYAADQLVLPAKTIVSGSVVSLVADKPARARARLGADFTPLRKPVVRFTSIVLPSGIAVPISTTPATDGAPIYRLVAPPPQKGGFVSKAFKSLIQAVKDRLKVVTGPDKRDRATQFLFSQMPCHPQRIAKGTSWTVETDSPVTLSANRTSPLPALSPPPAAQAADPIPIRILQAYLSDAMSSANSSAGQTIKATVAEPVYNLDGTLGVPQGSILTGVISKAHPARKFSRPGQLQFAFRQLTLPGQQPQPVRASLIGADSASSSQLAMDSEGEVKPKPQDKLVVPLTLLLLAARPFDQDGGREHHMLGKDAVASNSLGFIGFIIGTAAQKPNIAAGIGFYGAALSIYRRIFSKGAEVSFSRDTRIVVQTRASRSAAIQPVSP